MVAPHVFSHVVPSGGIVDMSHPRQKLELQLCTLGSCWDDFGASAWMQLRAASAQL